MKKPGRKKRTKELGERLRRAREQAGLSQMQAAELLKRPQSFVSRCETGTHNVSVLELEDFAKAYETELEFFFQESK